MGTYTLWDHSWDDAWEMLSGTMTGPAGELLTTRLREPLKDLYRLPNGTVSTKSLRAAVWHRVGRPVWSAVTHAYADLGPVPDWVPCFGAHDAHLLLRAEIVDPRGERVPALDDHLRLAAAAGWWWAFENVVITSERPRRIHEADGTVTISYAGGLTVDGV